MGKRGSGEGSIYKRPDGRWAAIVSLGWQGGKRRRKFLYAKSRREVQEKLTAALRSVDLGLSVSSDRATAGQLLEAWMEQANRRLRSKTLTSYQQIVDQHLLPVFGKLSLSKLTPQKIEQYLAEKQKAGLSARTRQYHHALLRSALNQAMRWGMVSRNVAALAESPKVQRPEVVPWTPDEARAFLRTVEGHRFQALYSVAIALGLRQGEALGLRWKDIDFERRLLQVRCQLQRISGKLTLVELKTEKSRRTIGLPAVTLAALLRHREFQDAFQTAAGDRWQENGLVFTTGLGTGIDQRNLLRHFYTAMKATGVRRIRFHDLRHTSASLLLAQGVPLKAISDVLGHSDIRLTANLYAHLFPEVKREIADQMDAVLAPVAVKVAVKPALEVTN